MQQVEQIPSDELDGGDSFEVVEYKVPRRLNRPMSSVIPDHGTNSSYQQHYQQYAYGPMLGAAPKRTNFDDSIRHEDSPTDDVEPMNFTNAMKVTENDDFVDFEVVEPEKGTQQVPKSPVSPPISPLTRTRTTVMSKETTSKVNIAAIGAEIYTAKEHKDFLRETKEKMMQEITGIKQENNNGNANSGIKRNASMPKRVQTAQAPATDGTPAAASRRTTSKGQYTVQKAADFLAKIDAPLKRLETFTRKATVKQEEREKQAIAVNQTAKLPETEGRGAKMLMNVVNMTSFLGKKAEDLQPNDQNGHPPRSAGLPMRPVSAKLETAVVKIKKLRTFAVKLTSEKPSGATHARPTSSNARAINNILNSNLPPPPVLVSKAVENAALAAQKTIAGMEGYRIDKVLGQGSYAVVRLAYDKANNQRVAIKTYEKFKLLDVNRRKNVKREIALLAQLDHLNVIKLVTWVETTITFNLIMEYIGDRSLYTYIKSKPTRRVPESEARHIFKQIVSGIDYVHSQGICHRDIKLENILLDDKNRIKLIDFGFAITCSVKEKLNVFCGTPSYMAPEIVSKKEYSGQGVDVWALGVVLYALLVGKFPFKGVDEKDLYRRISKGIYDCPPDLSNESKALISRILVVNPADRCNAKDILSDPWFAPPVSQIGSRSASKKQ